MNKEDLFKLYDIEIWDMYFHMHKNEAKSVTIEQQKAFLLGFAFCCELLEDK